MARITSKITSIDITDDSGQDEPTQNVTSPARPRDVENPVKPATLPEHIPFEEEPPTRFGWVTGFTVFTFLLWFAILVYLAIVVMDIPHTYTDFKLGDWVALTALVFLPIVTLGVGGYALRQLAKLTTTAQKLQNISERLITPDDTVIGKSKTMAAAIAAQIEQVNARLGDALGHLSGFENMIADQAMTLTKLNADSEATSQNIAATIAGQSETFNTMAQEFKTRMDDLAAMIEQQSGKLTTASQYAEQKIKESKISVEAAASKINAASDVVRSNIVQASSSLAASHHDIQSLGEVIKARSDELDGVYKKHAAELTAMIEQLRDEQQVLGANLEERLRKMRDLSLSAQTSAESLIRASHAGKETIEALAQSATLTDDAVRARFSEMEEMVRYSTEHARNISDLAASRVRDSLELTRKEILRIEHDMADLQARINTKAQKSLELVAEESQDQHTDNEPSSPKPRKRRLRLMPILDEPKPAPTPKSELEIPTPDDLASDLDLNDGQSDEEDEVQVELPLDTPADIELDELRRPFEDTPKPKSKSRFRLKNLFGGAQKDETDASLSIASHPPPATEPSSEDKLDQFIVELAHLGLAPNAIVDDGCIIEAANSRAAHGHE
ncbi:MAG TPA: hypothetical protein ENJ42_01945, partial [Hellea balneolensis]|nr:hypothetical protein [Hellea balneolensis]